MLGGLLDDPLLLAAAASDVGLDPAVLQAWCAGADVDHEPAADIEAARSPSAAAHALDHKLGGPPERRRYTAPSYVIARPPSEARARRGRPRVGRPAAGHGRGRSHHTARPRPGPPRTQPRCSGAGRRRRLLLDREVAGRRPYGQRGRREMRRPGTGRSPSVNATQRATPPEPAARLPFAPPLAAAGPRPRTASSQRRLRAGSPDGPRRRPVGRAGWPALRRVR